MKDLRTRHTALLLFTFLLASVSLSAQTGLQQKLSEISAITETQPLESTEFSEKYVTYFTQPLDHRHPKKGSFRQRVIVAHAGFDRPTAHYTEGYGAAYALKPQYREELSRLLNANMVFVEYRYFLESTPEPKDWRYLTAESSADDFARGNNRIQKHISRKMDCYRYQQRRTDRPALPHILSGRCGCIRSLRGSPLLRNRGRPSRTVPQKVSTDEDRKRITDFQLEILKRKAALLPFRRNNCTEQEYKFRAPIEEIYDYSVLEYSFALWQWVLPSAAFRYPQPPTQNS